MIGFDDVLKRRLVLFTGKGGVGKSTVVAAAALYASRKGKRPLIVEIDTKSAMKQIFDVPFLGFVPLEVTDNIQAINISAEESLAEYFEEHVKLRRLARMISNNSILQYFFKTAPGVNELVTINKLKNLLEQTDAAGSPLYDPILVDLPATGHALTFLEVPRAVRQLSMVGPLRKIADRFEQMLSDPGTTVLNLVTLPEEMPVTETIEMYKRITSTMDILPGVLFVNAVPEKLFDAEEASLLDRIEGLADRLGAARVALETGRTALERQRKNENYIDTLSRQIPLALIRLPRLFLSRLDLNAARDLAHFLPTGMQA